MDKLTFKIAAFFLLVFPFLLNGQQVITEKIQIDTAFISYEVIYKETIGDYFQLKKAVFAHDTSVVAIEKNFSNGVQNGLTRVYYPSGKLRIKSIYGNGKLQGEWTLYGEDGVIITKGVYNYGVKDGYWAYKSLKTYGRYSNGLKHRNWVKKDRNNQKFKAWFWNGKLKKGSTIFNENYQTHADTFFVVTQTDSLQKDSSQTETISIDSKLISAFKHIAQNYYFRKAAKDFFRTTKKERAKFIDTYVDLSKDVFKFTIAPATFPMNVDFKIAPNSKLMIDSILSVNGAEIQSEFTSDTLENNSAFLKYATDLKSNMVLFVSKPHKNIVAIELVEIVEETAKTQLINQHQSLSFAKMKLLVYINDKNEVVEVKYPILNQ
ncbi:MAG: hypothetical protein IT232_02880 [Flavobacteriales bacterium]|nr:hypothetical protein [Flavobacteriales bacterium]